MPSAARRSEAGFRQALARIAPTVRAVTVSEGYGRDRQTGELIRAALDTHPGISAVYSIGGGNAAIVAAFESARRPIEAFIAHDLDSDNRKLLLAGKLSAVLHHDLRQDMRRACQLIALPAASRRAQVKPQLSAVQIITPFNIPAGP